MTSHNKAKSPSHSLDDLPVTIEIGNIHSAADPSTAANLDHIPGTETCPICFNEYITKNTAAQLPCKHSFCLICVKEYLKTKTKNFQVIHIPCPQSGCKEIYPDNIIKEILDKNQYNRYRELVLKKVANRDLRNKFCPKPGCSKPFSAKKNEEYTLCSCGTKICNTCHNFWHEGKSCIESLDPEFELYSKENDVRFCIICKTVVKREEGCLHITCPICDYEWCWTCGREFNTFHECPGYWSPSPPKELRDTGFTSAHFKRVWKTSPLSKKFWLAFLIIILSPILLLGFMIFWPLFTFFNPERDLSRDNKLKTFCVVFGSFLFGLISLPVTIFYFVALLFGFLLLSPFLLLGGLVECLRRPNNRGGEVSEPKKRWLTGDPGKFHYTSNSRPPAPGQTQQDEGRQIPQENRQNGQRNPPVANNPRQMRVNNNENRVREIQNNRSELRVQVLNEEGTANRVNVENVLTPNLNRNRRASNLPGTGIVNSATLNAQRSNLGDVRGRINRFEPDLEMGRVI